MKKYLSLILVLCSVIVGALIYVKNLKQNVKVNGENYEFEVYDLSKEDLVFSRADASPEILKKYEWMIPATFTYGAECMRGLTEDQLTEMYESPPAKPKQLLDAFLKDMDFAGDISVVSVEKYKIGKEWYLLVGTKKSDLPTGIKYIRLLKLGENWVMPNGARDPDGVIIDLLDKISKEVKTKDFKKSNISDL